MMDEKRRAEVLAQLHHKLLGEPFEQPSAVEVEEVAWWEACELDRAAAAQEHLRAEVADLREESKAGLDLRKELDAAWAVAETPVRGMVSLAEVIEGRRGAYEELKAREAHLLNIVNAVRDAVAK